MNINAAFPSKYLKAANIPEGQTAKVRIDRIEKEDVSGKGEEPKPVLYFVGKDKGMVLNKTNARVIEAAYGAETDDWAGKPLEIYSGETSFAGDMVPCLRVRVPKAPAAAPAGGNSVGARPAPPARAPVASPVSDEAQFTDEDVPF